MTPRELKNSILFLAVNGRIVSQDSADEPAVHLVDAIRRKQKQLLSDGVIKREKFNSEIDLENDLPEGWCCAKLGELTTVVTKQTGFDYSKTIKPNLSETKLPGMIPMVQTKNFKGKQFVFDTDYYIPESIAKEFPKILLDSKCMLLSIVGASIGNIGIYPGQPLAMIGGAICKVTLVDDRLYDYLYYFLQSPLGQQEIKKNLKATAQGTITVQDVREITIKIPPLAEQKRIVAKIEELLPLIERYEKAWSRLEDFNKRFPGDMQKSILQMAIQGKLVEQRPEEGTGEALYKQIQTEKQALIKAGKIKKEKPLPEIVEDEVPFEIPESWKWVRVGNIGSWSAGATPSRTNPEYYGGPIPWLKTGDLNDDVVTVVPEFITQVALEKTSVRLNPVGSVLMAMYGATIGKLGIAGIQLTTNQACCACIPFTGIYNWYLFYFLMAMRTAFIKMGEGGAQPNISKEKIVSSLLPLPPLAEQKRIVARLEELLPLCERLK